MPFMNHEASWLLSLGICALSLSASTWWEEEEECNGCHCCSHSWPWVCMEWGSGVESGEGAINLCVWINMQWGYEEGDSPAIYRGTPSFFYDIVEVNLDHFFLSKL